MKKLNRDAEHEEPTVDVDTAPEPSARPETSRESGMTPATQNPATQKPATPKKETSPGEFDITTLRVQRAPLTAQPAAPGKDKRYIYGFSAAMLVLAAWLLYPRAVAVDTTAVTMVYPSQRHTLLNATGYVVPQLKAAVASKATGRLEWLGVAEGAHVKKDEVIARLESRDVQATLDNAAANVTVARAGVESAYVELKNANQALERASSLHSKGFLSKAAVEDAIARQRKANTAVTSARAALEAAEATANSADVAVDYTLIRAPFDGVILSKAANIGDIVTPMSSAADSKGAVVTMADMSTLEVEADVSESSLAQIRVDQPCAIMLDSIPNQQFRGVVSRIVPTIDRSKATVTTKVRFIDTDPRILPDMSAKVSFLAQPIAADQQRAVMAVSAQTLVERDGKHFVYTVNEGRAKQIEVVPGAAISDLVPIKGNLRAGDAVVLNPGRLSDGVQVALIQGK